MSLQDWGGSDGRFSSYVECLARVIRQPDRVNPLRDCRTGLMLPRARKSAESMAAPARMEMQH